MSKKSRFLGGLVGAGAVRGGTDSIFSETGGPLRFDDPTYGNSHSDCSMGPYNANGITLTNSGTSTRNMFIDLDLAGFTDSFFAIILNQSGLPETCQLVVGTYAGTSYSTTFSADHGIVAGTARIQHTASGFQAKLAEASASGNINSTQNAMCVAYDSSNKQIYFGYMNAFGGDVNWLKGSGVSSQGTTSNWTTTLPTADPTFDTDSFATNAGQPIKALGIQLPASSSVTYYAENWTSTNTPAGFNELRNAVYSSGTTDYARTTPKSGILTLDEIGPEGNGTSLSLSQMNWGGISGRSAVIETTNPSLDLNFDGTTSSYTRATTAADAAKANGDQLATSIVTQGKTGTVQSMYMGPNGKLIKGYVTNFLPESHPYGGSWTTSGTYTATNNYGAAPDGSTTSVRYQYSTANGFQQFYRNTPQAPTAGTVYTASIWYKGSGGFKLNLDQSGISGVNTNATFTATTSWQRADVQHTAVDSGGVGTLLLGVWFQGATGDADIEFWGAQIEEGAAPSELVQTTSGSASDQVARVEYDASGNPLGLLVEEQRTNLLTQSSDLTHSDWTASNVGVTANQVDPAGGTGAFLIEDSSTNYGLVRQQVTGVAGSTYTASLFVKQTASAASELLIRFKGLTEANRDCNLDTSTGDISGSPDIAVQDYNGWWRISVTTTLVSATTLEFTVYPAHASSFNGTPDATATTTAGTHIVYGPQVEAGEGATSYIPTTSGSVTRLKDVITVSTSDFGYDLTHTVALDATLNSKSIATFPYLVGQWDGTANNRDVLSVNVGGGTLYLNASDGGTLQISQAIVSGVTYPYTTKLAYGYHGTEAPNAENGVLGAEKTRNAAPVNARTDFVLGGNGNPNMHLRRFTYWPRAISDEQLAEYSYDLNFGGRMEYHGILSLNEVAQSRR